MSATATNGTGSEIEHVDVLIIGAGLSGIGAACRVKTECPQKSFAVLEARGASGGTWDLFRYPGIRSDSDMFTLGYSWRPWQQAEAIADGPAIRSYVRETAREYGVDGMIRYGHKVVAASWSSESSRWTVEVELVGSDERTRISCGFLFGNTGYYDYDEGFTPEFEGIERFGGEIVHPQHWPEDLDYSGKRVIVIGSGATAVTLVPAMAPDAASVTMVQRSPSYVVSLPGVDPLARLLKRRLPDRITYPIVRWKNVLLSSLFFQLCRRFPKLAKGLIRKGVENHLPEGYPTDPHFRPRYDPWDQRLCLVPDGDLFKAISSGEAEMVTDEIETFTEKGLRLRSGTELEADLIITATGLNLLPFGGIELEIDGERGDMSQSVGYKGMLFSGVPNMAMTMGYTNASWTLKADLVSEYFCRLLNHMDASGYDYFVPRPPAPGTPTEPLVDLKSGYVLRSIEKLPKQGDRRPWRLHQNYPLDILMLRRGRLEDEGIEFARAGERAGAGEPVAAQAGALGA